MFKAWNIQQIMAAGTKGNWQANAWLLERKYPDEFGRREKQEVKISGEVKTRVVPEPDYSNYTPEDWDNVERLAAKAYNGKAASRN